MKKTLIFFNLILGLFANSNALYKIPRFFDFLSLRPIDVNESGQIQQQLAERTINSLLTRKLNMKFGKAQPTPPTTATIMTKTPKVIETIKTQFEEEAILMPCYGQLDKCRVKEWTKLKKILHLMKLNQLIRLI